MDTPHAGLIRLLVTIPVVGIALAACGTAASSGPAASSGQAPVASSNAATSSAPGAQANGAADINGCSLLTSAQASAINHVTYGAATDKQVIPGWDQCTYANTGQHVNPVDIQPLQVSVMTSPDCWSQLQSSEGPGTKVSGVGDEAFGYQIGLVVRSGSRCIDVEGLTDAELQGDYSHDIAIAKIVLGHLH